MTSTLVESTSASTADVDQLDPAESRWPSRLLGGGSIMLATVAIATHATLYGYWIVDDAAITFAYARNVAEGFGPVLQPGAPPVEGFSNPTWMSLLAVGRWLGLFDQGLLFGIPDYAVYPKGLALLCCVGILAAAHLAAAKVTKRPWLVTLAVGLTLAAIPSFIIWSFSGLENSLYALLAVAIAVLVFRAVLNDRLLSTRVAILGGLLAAIAALTRPDGLIYAGVYPLVVIILIQRNAIAASVRHICLSTAAFAVPYGSYVCWRYVTFGQLLPNTAIAKSQDTPTLAGLNRVGELVTYVGTPLALVLAVVVGMALAQRFWWHRGLFALLVPLALALSAYVVLNPDWMPQYRFATPVWALGALVGVLATAEVLRCARWWGRAALSVLLAVVTAASGVTFAQAAQDFRQAPTVNMCGVADRFGRLFNGYANIIGLQQGSILLPDIGGTALTSRLRIYDMAGLASPRIAHFWKAGNKAGLRDYVFDELQPTFIHTHGSWSARTGVAADPRLADDYYPIYEYPTSDSPNGDWIRKEAISDQERLQQLRAHAQRYQQEVGNMPRRHCGKVLRPGQTRFGLY